MFKRESLCLCRRFPIHYIVYTHMIHTHRNLYVKWISWIDGVCHTHNPDTTNNKKKTIQTEIHFFFKWLHIILWSTTLLCSIFFFLLLLKWGLWFLFFFSSIPFYFYTMLFVAIFEAKKHIKSIWCFFFVSWLLDGRFSGWWQNTIRTILFFFFLFFRMWMTWLLMAANCFECVL